MFRSALALLACAGMTACADHGPCNLAVVTHTPLRFEGGRLHTEMTINGHTADMLVDTGGEISLLYVDAAIRYGASVRHLFGPSVSGIGGYRTLGVVSPEQVAWGRLHSSRFQLFTVEREPPRGDAEDGIIGMDLLANGDVDFDTVGGFMTLFRPTGACKGVPTRLAGQRFGVKLERGGHPNDPRPYLTVSIDGHEETALFDTGAAGSVIFRRGAADMGLDREVLAAKGRGTIGGIGPHAVDAVRYVAPQVTFGEISVRNLPFSVVDERSDTPEQVILGQDFMRRVHIWLSFSADTLVLEVPPLASPPFPAD